MDNSKNRQNENLKNKDFDKESTRRPDSEGYGSSSGRSGNLDRERSDIDRDDRDRDSMKSGNVDRSSQGDH